MDRLRELELLLRRLDGAAGESGAKIVVTSGYRCPARNAKVGGAKGSMHLQGRAFDFVATVPGGLLARARLLAWVRADLPPGGVGSYATRGRAKMLHYDTGPERGWGPHLTETQQ